MGRRHPSGLDTILRLPRGTHANTRLRGYLRRCHEGVRPELGYKVAAPIREDIIVSLAVATYIVTVFKLIALAFE
jgi:hypothetical protein